MLPSGALPIRLLQKSMAIRTAAGFGLGGIGYALGNLLLARALPPTEFGVFTLFLALVQIGAPLAPVGLEGQINRRPGRAVSLGRPLLTSIVVAAGTAIVASALYGMSAAWIAALIVAVTAGGASHVASAVFQSRLRFGAALTLSQGLAVVLLAMGMVAVVVRGAEPRLLAALVAAYYVTSAGVGWRILTRDEPAGPAEDHSLLEGLSLLGITAAALLLMQLERLLIPRLLTLEHLATFAVVATLVGSPFRMLQMGAGYTLLPRLSAAASREERGHLVRREAIAVGLMASAGASVLLLAAPWIAEWLLAGKYELSTALMLAALASGAVKLADRLATTIVWALGSPRQLALLNGVSWTCAGVGVAGGWLGARWGLIGLMYGVTLAWVCRGAVAAGLAAKQLRGAPLPGPLHSEPPPRIPS
jgi:O-antigen/teichoic acid export membrane protein